MSNKERSQKKLNAIFGFLMVDLVMLLPKRSNAHLIFKKLGQRKKYKKNIKNSIKKMLKNQVFSAFSLILKWKLDFLKYLKYNLYFYKYWRKNKGTYMSWKILKWKNWFNSIFEHFLPLFRQNPNISITDRYFLTKVRSNRHECV